ncbi:MAG: FecR domain-containing protein [Candidatus Peribacteria bacterium]|nr:MAG: FecR domain-containing protein [Candidatus Peribacteria bacterium]
MEYTEDNNLVTQIALALNAGSLWTKAPNYDDESEFEVYTTDMVAAVRGTVFGVTKDSNKSNITVEQGKVEIAEITEDLGIENLVEKIESNTPLSTESIDVSGVTEVQNGVSYIEVGRNETSAGVDLEETTSTSHAEEQLERDENITNNDQTDVESIEISSDTPPRITLQFRIKDKLKRAQHIVVSNAEGRFRTPLAESLSGNIITLVENTQFEPIQVERSIVSEPTLTLGGVSNGTQSLGQIIQGNAAIGVQVCRIVNRKVQCTRTKFVNTGNAMQYQYDSRTDTPETTREIQPIVRQSCIAELQDGTTIDIPHAQNIALYTTASIAYDAANTCEDERQIFSCNDGQLLSATRDLQ